jgi:hypothetical protein
VVPLLLGTYAYSGQVKAEGSWTRSLLGRGSHQQPGSPAAAQLSSVPSMVLKPHFLLSKRAWFE